MKFYKVLLLVSIVAWVQGCRIIQEVPEGGSIASASGQYDCPESQTCVVDVEDGSVFSDTFIAVPKAGYNFLGWKKADQHLCGGLTTPCALVDVPGDLTARDLDLSLVPIFEIDPDVEVGDLIWNIAVGDIDVMWGGSGWTDPVDIDIEGGGFAPYAHDLNGDGYDDVVITTGTVGWKERDGPRRGAIYLNNRDGTFTLANGDRPMSEHARMVLFEDFDGDSRTDLFILDHGWDAEPHPGFPNQLLLNRGQRFDDVSATHLPETEPDFSHGGAAGDIDNDGDMDIFVSNANVDPPYFLINDGTGRFTKDTSRLPKEFLSDATRPPLAPRLADLDQDGFLDLASTGWIGNPNVIYWGDSSSAFDANRMTVLPYPFFTNDSNADFLQIADINEDGLPDLLFGLTYEHGVGIQIVINKGERIFASETLKRVGKSAETGPDSWAVEYLFFDFNGDGTIDIVPGKYDAENGAVILAWLNDGTGHYAPLFHAMYDNPEASSMFAAQYIMSPEGFRVMEFGYDEFRNIAINEGIVTVAPVISHSGVGSDGADYIAGSNGDDTLTGKGGSDTFAFMDSFGDDLITDFEDTVDILDFSQSSLAFEDLVIFQGKVGARIKDTHGNTLTLKGVASTDITEDDFIFD